MTSREAEDGILTTFYVVYIFLLRHTLYKWMLTIIAENCGYVFSIINCCGRAFQGDLTNIVVGKPEGSTSPVLKLSSDGFKYHGLYYGISKGKVQSVLDFFYQGSATGKFDYKLTSQPFKNMFIGRPRVASCGCRLRMRPPGLTIYLPRIHLTFILQRLWESKWNSPRSFGTKILYVFLIYITLSHTSRPW